MSDEGQSIALSLSAPSSKTLRMDEGSIHSKSSILSSTPSDSTAVCWTPRGLSGRLLHALGPSTVDLVTRLTIKRRLSSISSQIDVRMRTEKKSLSEDEIENFGVAYRDLVELSSCCYKDKIRSQAILLRLAILRAFVLSERSSFGAFWHKRTLIHTWTELDDLTGSCDLEIQSTAYDLKRALVEKVTDELSGLRSGLHAKDLGTIFSGTSIVDLLCMELAYGSGSYALQSALDRISCSPWGKSQLRKLDDAGSVVIDAARRLLIDFDNVYSTGMAFKIFGAVAAEHKKGELAQLLSGPHGVGSLVARFDRQMERQTHCLPFSDGVIGKRVMDALCTALLSACCNGFMQEVVDQELCPSLITLVNRFVERDKRIGTDIDIDESENPDVERDQIAMCKLVLKLLQNEGATRIMLKYGAAKAFEEFGTSHIRQRSEWYLRFLIGAIRPKLDYWV